MTQAVVPKVKEQFTTHLNDTLFKFVEAWVAMQFDIMANFTVIKTDVYDGLKIMKEWEGRSRFAVELDINECRAVHANKRTAREAYVAKNHTQLSKMWKSMTEFSPNPYFTVNDPSIISFNDMVPPPSQQIFKYVDVTGDFSIKEMSGREWIMTGHRQKTAVFHGKAGCGKSSVAMVYAAAVAQLYPCKGEEQYFYKISASEALPRDDLRTGVPIIFDESMAMLPRGCNPPTPLTR